MPQPNSIPVILVLSINVGVSLDIALQLKRTRASNVFPAFAIDLAHFPRTDSGVIAIAESVRPLGVKVPQVKNHRIVIAGLNPFYVIKIGGYSLGALVNQVVGIHHIIRDQFSSFHDTRFGWKHYALP